MHLVLTGVLLGMGAAIPIGPVNLEIIRRNLRFGTPYGVTTGLGACTADLTYLVLLCLGALFLLQYPDVLRATGMIGSLILAWFGISALRSKPIDIKEKNSPPSLIRYTIEGYLITLINPYTILFCASISSQISITAAMNEDAVLFAGSGVMIGSIGWVIFLNTLLHFTRSRLTATAIKWLNYIGGIILLSFAITGFLHAYFIASFK